MKALLIYPEFPNTFWSFKYALKFVSKKAPEPPLGLLTVASMLPESWDKRIVDMNVTRLNDSDIEWADIVFLGAMSVQADSAHTVISRCKILDKKIVAGGPLFTSNHHEFSEVDHFVLNEAELTLPRFLDDLANNSAENIYSSDKYASLENTPIPMWELLNIKKYATMDIQYSRGCPFDCEFCNITALYGHKVRTKTISQIISELERLYSLKWRGEVFFVDDNFIGNRRKLKRDILPGLIEWMKANKYPFSFSTECSINLADDEELMDLMGQAGFHSVFVGIETVDDKSLRECNKIQNLNRDLLASIRKIQDHGLAVKGGFIVGFDHDHPGIFHRLSNFIQESGIVTAMVGLLNAPRGTRLYKRMVEEKRLLNDSTGSNTDFTINFIPRMNQSTLMLGIRTIIKRIYSPRPYYRRVKKFLREYKPLKRKSRNFRISYLKAFAKTIFILGIFGRERFHFWNLLFWTLFRRPKLIPNAVTLAVYGFHFRKIYEEYA